MNALRHLVPYLLWGWVSVGLASALDAQQRPRFAPAPKDGEIFIARPEYALSYNEEREQAAWVAYCLTLEEARGSHKRSNTFRTDPFVGTGSAENADYRGSGYDRGHLAPAADMAWSAMAMKASFYYSNVSPQLPGFNRGIWKRLERLMRGWAKSYDSIYIITGPLFLEERGEIGPNGVDVPSHFFKAVLRFGSKGVEGIAFVLPHRKLNGDLAGFAISLDNLELLLETDVFAFLPAKEEDRIEARRCLACWDWEASPPMRLSTGVKEPVAQRCHGITKKGKRCKRTTKDASGFCWQHS